MSDEFDAIVERVRDRVTTDPEERDDVAGTDDEVIAATREALVTFESEMDGEWGDVDDGDVLDDMGDEAKDRLQDLGYIE